MDIQIISRLGYDNSEVTLRIPLKQVPRLHVTCNLLHLVYKSHTLKIEAVPTFSAIT